MSFITGGLGICP